MANFGHFKSTLTNGLHKNAYNRNILCPRAPQKVSKGPLDCGSHYLGVKGSINLFSIKPINHDMPKLTKINLVIE